MNSTKKKVVSKKLYLRKEKKRLIVARIHERIKFKRDNFSWKKAGKILKHYDIICVEKLNVKNMMRVKGKGKNLAKSIQSVAWNDFLTKLVYKAEKAGKQVIEVNPRNTSSTCYHCGFINKELTLSDSQWVCPQCEKVHDRDVNAAKNIRRLGLQSLALAA